MATAKSPQTQQQQAIPHVKESDFKGNCARVNHIINILWGKAASASTTAVAGAVGPAGPAGPAGSSTGTYTQITPGGSSVTPSLSGGNWSTIEVLLNAATITINNPTGGSTGTFFLLVLVQDATGGRTIAWGSAYHGVSDQIWTDSNPSVYWAGVFVIRPDGKAMLVDFPFAGEAY